MRPSLKALRSRASDRARSAAHGDVPPAGREPFPRDEGKAPGAVERGALRRRLRRARRMREALMTELGALVMEMQRQGRHDRALVERKAREALVLHHEATGLARALGAGDGIHEVVAAGIAGSCAACGALFATDDRFCARCGAATVPVANGRAAFAPGQPPVAAPPPDAATIAAPPPDPATIAAPPPHPAARVAEPPDPATRAGTPGQPGGGPPPPPDPRTRVRSPDEEADTVQIATSPRRS